MTKPVRLQLSRRKGFDLQKLLRETNRLEAVVVARPTKWGNPFQSTALSQQEKVNYYRIAAQGLVPIQFFGHCAKAVRTYAIDQCDRVHNLPFRELRGKNLACWCPADQPYCHADVLLELANA